MLSDQFDLVRARALGCRPISPGLDPVHCRQLILKLIGIICGNCLNAINNGSACSIPCSKTFLRAGNNPAVLKNSTEHAEPLFIALIEFGKP